MNKLITREMPDVFVQDASPDSIEAMEAALTHLCRPEGIEFDLGAWEESYSWTDHQYEQVQLFCDASGCDDAAIAACVRDAELVVPVLYNGRLLRLPVRMEATNPFVGVVRAKYIAPVESVKPE